MNRHPILVWAFAWGLTGVGLLTADVWSEPRRGPIWVGLLFGMVAWGIAGGVTLRINRPWISIAVWMLAYGIAFWLGGLWGDWFEANRVGHIASAGFIGALFGWSAGSGLGALATAALGRPNPGAFRSAVFAAIWALCFLIAGYVGLAAGVILGELSKVALGFLGNQRLALTIGWGLGSGLGGLIAATGGMAAWRGIACPSGTQPSGTTNRHRG